MKAAIALLADYKVPSLLEELYLNLTRSRGLRSVLLISPLMSV